MKEVPKWNGKESTKIGKYLLLPAGGSSKKKRRWSTFPTTPAFMGNADPTRPAKRTEAFSPAEHTTCLLYTSKRNTTVSITSVVSNNVPL